MPRSPFRVAQSFTLSASPTSVASGDLNGDGHPDLVVTRLGSGSIGVLLGNGKGSFSAGVDYAAGTTVSNALVADFNGDGKLDVAVTDSATGSIDVLFGNGDGTFGKPEVYAGLGNAVALAAGRFAGSGKVDLAVASATGVDVLLNDGTGHFSAAAAVAAGSQPRSLAAADLKATGHDDLIVANQDGTLTVLLGDGAGHFSAQPDISAAHGPLSSIIAGDFNADGKVDLAVAQANSNAVTVLLGHGDGAFESGVNYAVGNGPARIIAADLNADGAADLVSINRISNTFSVLLGNGDGTFRPSVDFVAGNTPLGLVAGDFNSDGHADLAIVNSQDQTLAVPLGRGDGTFAATPVYRADLLSKAIAAGDLNGDGRADLVVSNFCGADSACAGNGTATIFLANADGTYRAASTIALGVGPVSVALADLNGDKKLDLIALNSSDKTLSILAGNGDGTFGKSQLYSLSASPRAIFVGDFNGDGKPDLAIASDCGQSACNQPGSLDIWLGRGDGSVAASASYTVGYSPVSIAAADLRSTGHLDVVVANACGDDSSCNSAGTATLLSNDGAGKFTASGEVALGSAPSSIAIGNLTGSGLDLAVAERGSNQVAVLHADGKGGFGAPVTYAVGAAPSAVTIADVNGDGRPDVAVAGFQSSTVSVLYGNSSGKLDSAVSFPVGAGPESLVAVSKASGSMAGLVTANGDTGAAPMGSGITALGGSDPGTGTSTVAFTTSANTANVDQQVTMTGSVTAVSPAGTPTGSLVFAIDASGTGAGPFTYLADCGGSTGVTLTAASATCTTQLLPAGTDNIQLQYSGDPTYAANASAADQAQTISPAATTVTVGATTTGTVDQQITLNATVAPSTAPAVATNDAVAFSATGSIEFFSDGTPITGCNAAPVTNNATNENATASCQTTALTASGSPHTITAQYNTGDPNYNGSTLSASVNQTIQPAATAVTITSVAPSAPTVDQTVTISAKVAPSSGSVVIPFAGSSMAFYIDGSAISTCMTQPVDATAGTASCTVDAGLAVGSHQVTAAYNSGDANYSASARSPNFPVPVTKAATHASVSPSPSASTVDQPVTLTATITPNVTSNEVSTANIVALTANVSFSDNGTVITGCGGQPITFASGAGTASCTTSALAAGTHSNIIATYLGDSSYNSSPADTPATVTVSTASSTVAVTALPAAPALNQAVVFTAAITFPSPLGVTPTGTDTVSFSDNGVTIAGCSAQPITVTGTANIYQAICDDSSLTGGSHAILATFSGDANYNSTLGSLSLTIASASSGTSVTSSANPSTVNQSVSFTVSVQGGTSVKLTGTATVTADGTTGLGQCTLAGWSSTTGIATCMVSSTALSKGSHTISASYSGDPNYSSSSGSLSTNQVVNAATATLGLSSVPATTSSINASVAFTAVLTVPSGSTAPAGTVAFTDTPQGGVATAIATCSAVHPAFTGTSGPNSTYSAACSTSSLALGSHTITATYGSDNNFTSVPAGEPFTVSAASASITLASSALTSTVNQAVTFTATIPIPSGNATLKGTVAFTDNGATINNCGTVTPSSVGVATCSDPLLTAGSHNIVAAYSGDPNFNVSQGNLTQTVNKAGTSLAVSSSQNPTVLNQPVTFTATLTAPAGTVVGGVIVGVPITGTISFTDTPQGGTAAPIPSCSALALTLAQTSGQTSTYTATCTTSALVVLSHTITATFGPDTNFATSSGLLSQTVNATTSNITLSAVPASNVAVNQSVQFTAAMPSQVFGPQGKVTFTDNGLTNVIPGCSGVAPTTNWIATCTDPSLTAGAHTIVAQYAGDPNINVGNGTLTLQVGQAASTTVVTPPSPAFPASPVTFTATVSAPAGAVIPLTSSATAGSVTFTVNGTVICANQVLTLANTGLSGTAMCSTTTAASGFVDGNNSIVAQYSGDPNYSSSNNCPTSSATTCVSEVVQDYSIAVKSVLQGNVSIPVTLGSTTANDPFASLSVSASSFGTFSGSPSITCTSASTGAPACNLAQSTLQVVSGGTSGGVGIVIDATGSNVAAGTYAFTVTATDAATSNRTATFNVVVSPVSSALTVVSGTPATGTVTLPAGVTLSSLSCLSIAVAGTSTTENPANLGVSCTSFAQGTASSQYTMTVNTNNKIQTSLLEKSDNHPGLLVAGLLGLPLFGLFGLISGRKSLRSNFFRLLAIAAVGIAVLQTLGCGGSFQSGNSTSTTATGTTPAGTYYLLVEGTANGNKYDAVLEVIVTVP